MARLKLSRRWIAWRRRRYGELASSGLPFDLAWDTAKGEASARQRIARTVGADAAAKADLAWIEREGKPVFVLIGALADLDDRHREKIWGKYSVA